jgi:hypothetical protein
MHPYLDRAFVEAKDDVWHDVKVGVVLIALATIIGMAALDLPWDKFVLAGLLGTVALFVLAFLYRLLRIIVRPHLNKKWRRVPTTFAPATFTVEIRPLMPVYVGRSRCEITGPNGVTWTEPTGIATPELTRALHCHYPESFPDAPPPRRGTYKVRWLIGRGSTGWRELMRYEEAFG